MGGNPAQGPRAPPALSRYGRPSRPPSLNLRYFFYSGSFSAADGTKRTVLDAGIFIGSPVFGLRPVRAARFATLKEPKPTICTAFFLATPFAMHSSTASTASPAARL